MGKHKFTNATHKIHMAFVRDQQVEMTRQILIKGRLETATKGMAVIQKDIASKMKSIYETEAQIMGARRTVRDLQDDIWDLTEALKVKEDAYQRLVQGELEGHQID